MHYLRKKEQKHFKEEEQNSENRADECFTVDFLFGCVLLPVFISPLPFWIGGGQLGLLWGTSIMLNDHM